MKPRIQDIADRAGVSIATVSRVLNHSGYVSAETRRKVEAVIAEFNYKPSTIRNHIRDAERPYIGVMVKGIGNTFFQQMTRELERDLLRNGYATTFHDVLHLDEMAYVQKEITTNRIKGAILMGGSGTYTLDELNGCPAPIVMLTVKADPDVPADRYGSVTLDDVFEGYKATMALINMGHRHIGFIYTDPTRRGTPNYLRYVGYRRALDEARIPYDPLLVAGANESTADLATELNGYRLGYRMTQRLLQQAPRMSALFCYSDTLAIGAAKAALVGGRRIPEDLSIIGFDGVDEAEFYHPAIDTIYQPTAEMVHAAVEILTDMIRGEPSDHRVFSGTLIRRGSTQTVKGD